MTSFTVAIIGRPNVGKSTIFNRLIGKKIAITDDLPGVTRDRKYMNTRFVDMDITLIDTAGLEQSILMSQGELINKSNLDFKLELELKQKMFEQSKIAANEADLIIFVIDAKTGVVEDDKYFAKWLRQVGAKNILLVVNKSEARDKKTDINDLYKLGFDKHIFISAEHNEGMAYLYEGMRPFYDEYQTLYGELNEELTGNLDKKKPNRNKEKDNKKQEEDGEELLQFSVIGRPNVGKSTFINSLLGENRLITGDKAGITRDTIAIDFDYNGKKLRLVDTAGIRRKSNIDTKLEELTVSETIRSIKYSKLVILILDALSPVNKQDLNIVDIAITEGRAVLIAINKWDLIGKSRQKEMQEEISYIIEKSLPQIKSVPIMYISALKGSNVEMAIDKAIDLVKIWGKYISTSRLNNWLHIAVNNHLPPMVKGKRLKFKYITQGKKRPPTFMIFTNMADHVPESYVRYLTNSIREEFDIPSVPIRIVLKQEANPYDKTKKKK